MSKKISLFLLNVLFMAACHTAQTPVGTATTKPISDQPAPSIFVAWDKKKVDLGPVKKGEKRSLDFTFTNTSGKDVQIEIVDACDCTTVDYPRGVITPGGQAKLDVVFNSAEKDADETIPINVIFKNTDAGGNPRIETVSYSFQLVKP